jgi:PAS domain S-box-containing protein
MLYLDRRKQSIHIDEDRRKKQNNDFFDTIMEQLSVMIAIVLDNKIIYANTVFFNMLGYNKDELEKINVSDVLSNNQKEILLDRIKRRIDGDLTLPDSYENIEIIKKNGESLITTIYPNLIYYNGKLCTLYAGLDFTGQRRNEKALNQFFEYCPTAAFIKDMQFRLIKVSPQYEKIINMPMLDIIGKTTNELFPTEIAEKLIEEDVYVSTSKKPITVEEKINDRIFLKTKYPINGRYIGGFSLDITERVNIRQQLEEEHKKYHNLYKIFSSTLDNMNDMIWICDDKQNIIYQNKSLLKSNHIIDLIGLNEMLYFPCTKETNTKKITYNESNMYFEITKNPIFDNDNTMIGCFGKIKDITEIVENENKRIEKFNYFQKEVKNNVIALTRFNSIVNSLNKKEMTT